MESLDFKKTVYSHCLQIIERRIKTIQDNLKNLMEAKLNETKSSAGDKYETGMAMIQNEEDLYKRQLADTSKTLEQFKKIDSTKINNIVEPGAMVKLPAGWFYISAGMGKIIVDDQDIYCISLQSPIGVAIKNLKEKDIVSFNEQKFTIHKIY